MSRIVVDVDAEDLTFSRPRRIQPRRINASLMKLTLALSDSVEEDPHDRVQQPV